MAATCTPPILRRCSSSSARGDAASSLSISLIDERTEASNLLAPQATGTRLSPESVTSLLAAAPKSLM